MKNLAVCIFTIDHPEVVRDVLERAAEEYYKLGIDIYYYDSSATDDTRQVVESFVERGYHNLYYVKVDGDFNDKIHLVYSGYGLVKEYDYIWPSKDRSFCTERTLCKVQEAMEEGHDYILIGTALHLDMDYIVYEEAKEFYRDWAVVATSLDAVIYKRSTVLKKYNKERLAQQYPGDYIGAWRVYLYVFTSLCELEKYSIKVLTGSEVGLYNSPLGISSIHLSIFQTWKEHWIWANDNLPTYYDEYKDKVIKEAGSWPWMFGSVEHLQELHEKGLLVPEKIAEIEQNWERVSDIPFEKVKDIAFGTYDSRADVDLLGHTGNEVIDIIIQMHRMIYEERMRIEEIPVEDIVKCVQMMFVNKYTENHKFAGIFEVAIQDVADGVTKAVDKKAACRSLLHLINLLFLLE